MKLQPRAVFIAAFATRAPIHGFYGTETTLLERADLGCLLVNSAIASPSLASELSSGVGIPFPLEAGASVGVGAYRVLWLTPRSWLIHCWVEEEQALAVRINESFPNKHVHATLFTDYLCWFELTGPKACGLLTGAGFTALEGGISIGHAKRTLLAGVQTVLLRESSQAWLLGVERSRAIYMVARLDDAARRSHSLRDECTLRR